MVDRAKLVAVQVGDSFSGYTLERDEYVHEIRSQARVWVHEKTGAELLSISNTEENKAFGVTLRTPPTDSTGVPHILEHSVLCGSRKYPVKEPFVELMKSSLQTFLNAMTFPDKTMYPVASCNLQDFHNLVDVYLDAVFFPRLTPDTLAQEGHHIELDSPQGELAFKGVVYNEMKGVFSSPESVLRSLSQRVLYPDITYGVESGGDPRDIPDLKWEQFKGFHERFYHPSNARLFFYGDDDEESRLRITDAYLTEFSRRDVTDSRVALQTPFKEPRRFSYEYDAGSEGLENKYMATVNWMLPEITATPPMDVFALELLSAVLLGTSGAPLQKALVDSGLGDEVVGGGLETDLRQMAFSVGLKGMKADGTEQMHELVLRVLSELAQQGFSRETIDASLNTIEFRLREANTGGFPRGLVVLINSLSMWLHESDPLTPLRYEAPLAELKARLDAGERVLESLIEKHFLQNTHRVTVELKPDAGAAAREEARERARLDAAKQSMKPEDLERLVAETERLKAKQMAHDDPAELAKIPCLKKSDLPLKNKTVAYSEEALGSGSECGARLFFHEQPTNGIAYVDMGFDMRHLPSELLPYMSLFTSFIKDMGTAEYDYVAMQQRIGRETGGIRFNTYISELVHHDVATAKDAPLLAMLTVRGKCVPAQVQSLTTLMRELLLDTKWDNKERFKQLVIEERAATESSVAPSGHQYASSLIRAQFRASGAASEKMGGLAYLTFLRALEARLDSDWDAVYNELLRLRDLVVQQQGLIMNVTADADGFKQVRPALETFFNSVPPKASPRGASHWSEDALFPRRSEAVVIPAQINYVGKGGNLKDLGFDPTGGSYLAAKYLGTSYLWDTVRVQGGAYGGFCSLDMRTGNFLYLSYRDPNIKYTLDAYDKAPEFLRNADVGSEDLEKAIIGAIGDMDSYSLPDAKGYASMLRVLTGETDDLRQERREQILGASVQDFRALGDALEEMTSSASVVVVGSKEAVKKARDEGVAFDAEASVF
ncbi:Presequence protease 1, chloroplastic/mitochondrial [Porphyridium purpureum]|uniref:Presequence protease 1, chloroplastic/mitochondrial n=1 Tax=Porphyridium purpureum TaxID=35688 RepID=A0A5J4Z0Z0_PORPP|nr:Presequence protease 1, chloroplastic/mitochondrial [Porphyridium purpureum]|eukprot:POR7658..scf208_2